MVLNLDDFCRDRYLKKGLIINRLDRKNTVKTLKQFVEELVIYPSPQSPVFNFSLKQTIIIQQTDLKLNHIT